MNEHQTFQPFAQIRGQGCHSVRAETQKSLNIAYRRAFALESESAYHEMQLIQCIILLPVVENQLDL